MPGAFCATNLGADVKGIAGMASVAQTTYGRETASQPRVFMHWRLLGVLIVALACSGFWVGFLSVVSSAAGYSLSTATFVTVGTVIALFAAAVMRVMPASDDVERAS